MALHVFLFLLVVCLLSLALLWRLGWLRLPPSHSQGGTIHSRVHRRLLPRTPLDCPACRLASTPSSGAEPTPVRPWREVKSRRRAPKRANTQGFACPNQQCAYFGITDAHMHALVGDGKHGHAERIQTFRGPACHTTFTARRDTPLYHLKTPSQQVGMVLSALAEGLDQIARLSGSSATGSRRSRAFLTRAGQHAQTLHERCFRHLWLPHLQLDHCCAPGCAAPHRCCGFGWPSILAPRFFRCSIWVHARRTWHIASSIPCESSWPPFCLPLFTSDGLNLYFYALTAHFGHWLDADRQGRHRRQWQVEPSLIYGQVKKCYRRRKLVRVSQVMRLGTVDTLKAALQGLGFSGRLNTAWISRVNLTVRHGVAALARRTWATAQQSPYLLAHLEWWRAYYHFVRPHASLRVRLVKPRERGGKRLAQHYRQRTKAPAAGRTHRRWTAREVLSCPLLKVSA
jgi:hypothetical protein